MLKDAILVSTVCLLTMIAAYVAAPEDIDEIPASVHIFTEEGETFSVLPIEDAHSFHENWNTDSSLDD